MFDFQIWKGSLFGSKRWNQTNTKSNIGFIPTYYIPNVSHGEGLKLGISGVFNSLILFIHLTGEEPFLVTRVLLPPPVHQKWFEYTTFASWEGRFVADSRPAISVEAEEERFQIVDVLGIQYPGNDLELFVLMSHGESLTRRFGNAKVLQSVL